MAEAKLDVKTLVAALDAKRQAKGLSWRQLAQKADVSQSTLTRMHQGKRPDVDTFASLVRWLGMPAEEFLKSEHPKSGAAAQAHPLARVSTYLRGGKEMSPQTLQAIEDLIQAAYKLAGEIHDEPKKRV